MNIVICIPNKYGHYLDAKIGFMSVYYDLDKSIRHYPIDLTDVDNVELPKIKTNCVVVNKRLFDTHYKSIASYDLETQAWLGGESVDLDVINFRKYLKHYRRLDYYRYVPYYVYVAMSEKLIHTILNCKNLLVISKASDFYTNVIYPSIETIERNCMYVKLDSFNNNFNRNYTNNFVKVLYNIHTKTGRPSNVYDGVNYSAINKKDDSRLNFISRFDSGYLVEYDFDSYHIRIIGKLLNYDFSDIESLHTYFAKMYFNTDTITESQYEDSKKISFTLLYKDDKDLCDRYNIDFFNKVYSLKEKIWEQYQNIGYVDSPITQRKLSVSDEMNKSKLFSYYIQMIETELSMLFIHGVNTFLNNKKSKMVLYTYDSILIDYNVEDGYDLLKDLKKILINSKVKKGKNYKDMELFSIVC